MDTKSNKQTLVLAAAGILTTAVGLTGSTASAEQPSQIQNQKTSSAEVLISLVQLEQAEQRADGSWRVRVHPGDLSGIEVPEDLVWVELQLTEQQMGTALQTAKKRNAVRFSIGSTEWVEQMEERLLGGFSIKFAETACDYTQTWS